jgi:trimeric autotransporter adhesin
MRKNLLIAIPAIIGIFVCFQLFYSPAKKSLKDDEILPVTEREGGEEKEDGIAEAQKMEFEYTKDIKLGYIPKDRLIRAGEDLKTARIKGTYANRTNALSWSERGPNTDAVGPSNGNGRLGTSVTSGRMRAIWVDLQDVTNKIVWVGSISGGLWKTTDITASPATWTLVNDFLGNLSISSICQDPTGTKNTMYYATGEKSNNADAVKGGGIWKSIDHGVTWSLLPSTTTFWNASKIVCDAAGNVYVAAIASLVGIPGSTGGIYRSTDGGTTWTNISPAGLSARIPEMEISSTGRMHINCGYRNTAAVSGYRFTDNPSTVTSATWTSPVTSYSPVEFNVDLAVAGNTLYALPASAAFETPQVWKSTDGGNNWAITTTTPAIAGMTPLSSGQAWYNLAISVDPTDANKVMVGGLNSYITNDGGATWLPNSVWVTGVPGSANYIHADHHTIVWNNNQVLNGGDGGIFYSADDGVTFSDRNVGLRLKQFYACAIHPTSTNYFLAGAQDNGVHQLNAAGLTGSVEVTGGDGAYVHIDEDEPQFQFGSYLYNQYRRSTDGGSSWGSVNYGDLLGTFGQFINPTDYDDINNNLYAPWTAGNYLRWMNASAGTTAFSVSVSSITGANKLTHTSVSKYTTNRVYFGSANGKLIRADNANTAAPTLTDITGTGMSATTVSCIAQGTNENNLLATFSNYGSVHIWASTTGGGAAGWTNITGTGLPDIPVRWAMFYPEDNTKAIIATEMGIYETNLINGASTLWVQNASFPVVKTNMLQYRFRDNTILASTHGRGLWTATIPPANPYVRFASSYTYNSAKTEATTASTGACRDYTDYTLNMHIDLPPTGAANVTLTIAGGATATQGVDYDFTTNGNFVTPSNVLTFPNASTADQPITIRVYNDGEVESLESFTFNYTIGGGTNALSAPSSQSYTFFVADNDVTPVSVASGTRTIGAGDFAGGYFQPLRSNFQKARSQYIYLASELKAAGIIQGNITALGLNVLSKTSTIPYTGLTVSLKNTASSSFAAITFETGTTQCYSQNYSTVSGTNTLTFSTPFNWDGTSNLLVEICFDNTAVSGTGDLVSTNITTDAKGVWNRANAGTGCTLSAAFNTAGSFIRPDIILTGDTGNPIETVLNNNKTNYVGSTGTHYFYSSATSNVISSLTNASANLGCVTSNIFTAGNTWQTFSGGNRSQKVIEITPTTNSGASYTVGLYFTAAELGIIDPNIIPLKIAKTTAATMAGANSGNTVIASATSFSAFGTGYLFTATFTGFSKFFLVDNSVTLPVSLLTFDGRQVNNTNVLDWSTSAEQNSKEFEIEKSSDDNNFYSIGIVPAAGNSSSVRNYSFTDKQVNEFNYYRLKMIDIDRRSVVSRTILLKNPNAEQNVRVVENPFRSSIAVRFAKVPQQKVRFELVNVAGAVVYRKEYGSANQITIDLSGLQLSKGTYILMTLVDGKSFTNKLVKQ